MADVTSASILPLHQPQTKTAKTPAQRAKAYRDRKRAAALPAVIPASAPAPTPVLPTQRPHATPLTLLPPETVTPQAAPPARRHAAPALLTVAALALALVGMIMNGWFARSLGSTEAAGWLFLAIGVAADLVALVIPSCAAALWAARQRATALAGWLVWSLTFAFALAASIGFASVNIADVTASRASRVTPAVTAAQAALADAMAARDRECRGGVGKFCRDREATVTERRQALDVAMRGVEQAADPQVTAAIGVVAWVSRGTVAPTENDFAMLRLILLALLPQIGGIVLMVGRRA